jgi:hypothetical protein
MAASRVASRPKSWRSPVEIVQSPRRAIGRGGDADDSADDETVMDSHNVVVLDPVGPGSWRNFSQEEFSHSPCLHPTTKAKPASRQVHIVGYPVVRS